ncbi:MAG: MlrC C-terminal domain-containing protein, partial [Roseicyclus sp.]
PLIAQATGMPAVARLCAAARADEGEGGVHAVQLIMGFPYADIAEAGPAILVHARDAAGAEAVADRHLALWRAAEPDLAAPMAEPAEAVARAKAKAGPGGPVVLADVQDNPGGGAPQDTTGLLHALIAARAEGAVLVHLCDAQAAAAAHAAGVGARLHLALGGRSDPAHGAPVPGPFEVAALGPGRFTGEGPMYRGNAIDLGPVALLRRAGVGVIVAGRRMQASEPGLLRHLGLAPEALPILAVKSSVHFRGAYQAMAREIILVEAPGAVPMALDRLPFARAVRPVARAAHTETRIPEGMTP